MARSVRRTRGEPLRQRRQMKTRHRWTWRSLFRPPIPQLTALAVVFCALYGVATSRLFSITTVQATGQPGLPVNLFRQYCGCAGDNIFLARPDDIRWRLGRIPWVNVRRVYARLPNRIVVDAVYRQPALLWRTTDATYTVDLSGEVLYDVRDAPVPAAMVPTTATLPLVYSPHDTTFVSGQHVPRPIAVQMVLATRADLPRDIAPSVDVYRWSDFSGLTVHSHLGWWFTLGIFLHGDLHYRLTALDGLYRSHHLDGCNYIDLTVLPNTYCRYELQWHGPLGP